MRKARKPLLKILALCFIIVLNSPSYADPVQPATIHHHDYDNVPIEMPWAVLAYYGRQGHRSLLQTFNMDIKESSAIYSLEILHELSRSNIFTRFFAPISSASEVALNGVYRDDSERTIYGFDLYGILRWRHFPWDHYIRNSVGIGQGIAYNNRTPEGETFTPDKPHRLLNYIMFEMTFAHPNHPALQLVVRIHHRSGVFGLYGTHRSGSTALGIGLRFVFL